MVLEAFVLQPIAEGAFQSGHARLDQTATVIAAGLFPAFSPQAANAPPLIDPNELTPYVDPLPRPPLAKAARAKKRVPYYEIPIQEFFAKVHRDVPATRFWGYGNSIPGPTI